MNIKVIRLLNCLLTIVLIYFKKTVLLYYVASMHGSLELLNSQQQYLQNAYKIYNSVFWSYELVLTERLRKFKFSQHTEWLLNNAEHIAFAMVICFKIYIYLALFVWKKEVVSWKQLLLVAVIFNLIGLLNEYFQNASSQRPIFLLIDDGIKDIQMNFMGTAIFMLIVLCRIWFLRKTAN